MKRTKRDLEQKFICPKCRGREALVREVRIGRTAARLLPLPASCYYAASCTLCGYTEFYDMALLVQDEVPAPARAQPAAE